MLNALFAMALAAAAPAQPTDTVVPVDRDTRLSIQNQRGEIVIDTWERSAVRIVAEHSARDDVSIERRGSILRVRSRAPRGAPGAVDYRITLPAWLPIDAAAPFSDVRIDGVTGDVEVETVQGEIEVRGGRGRIATHSVDGDVSVADAEGEIEIETVNGDVRVVRVNGGVRLNAINGDVEMDGIRSSSVDATTVNGDVAYAGTIREDGRYRFATHNGDVRVTFPTTADVTVTASTFNGELDTSFPVQLTEVRSDRRFRFVLGSGAAALQIETFQGTIELRRSGDTGDVDWDHDGDGGGDMNENGGR